MKITGALGVAVVTAVSVWVATPAPALAYSNGVEVNCAVTSPTKVEISAITNNPFPTKCSFVCRIKYEKGGTTEVAGTDKTVEGFRPGRQVLLEKDMGGPITLPGGKFLDYTCKKQ